MGSNYKAVKKFRKLKGNDLYAKKYHFLREGYGIDSKQANKMKHWSSERIIKYIEDHDIKPIMKPLYVEILQEEIF